MLEIKGSDFVSVLTALPRWLGASPDQVSLHFDKHRLFLRAIQSTMMIEHIFSDIVVDHEKPFDVAISFETIISLFKANEKIQFHMTPDVCQFRHGAYRGEISLLEYQDVDWPNFQNQKFYPWITPLLDYANTITLKKSLSQTNPLVVFFSKSNEAIECSTADGTHIVYLKKHQSSKQDFVDLAIPYSSFKSLIAAFKGQKDLKATTTNSHLIISNNITTLYCPFFSQQDSSINMEAVRHLVYSVSKDKSASWVLNSGLNRLKAFLSRAKAFQVGDTEIVLHLFLRNNKMVLKFVSGKGQVQESLVIDKVVAPKEVYIKIHPMAFADTLSVMDVDTLHFFVVESQRLIVQDETGGHVGILVGLT